MIDPTSRTSEGSRAEGAAIARRKRGPWISLDGCAILLGSFLLFQVQPIVAKAILPRFGGVPAVWTTCMLFFQTLLLAGYAYAHASTSRLRPRMQGVLHLVLLGLALLCLPIAPSSAGAQDGARAPVLAILALLGGSVALPYFLLSASTPLIQSWSTLRRGDSPPYRLYALSNAGSMLALLTYPVAVEPWLATSAQELAWSAALGGYVLLVALRVRALWRANPAAEPALRSPADAAPDDASAPAPGRRQRCLWIALPACAAILLLAVTNQLCQEVAVVPFLWILPLSLYLLSFIVCFASDRFYSRGWCMPVLILTLLVMVQAATLGPRVGIAYAVPVYSVGLFVCCTFCHGEVAARRPAPRFSTSFYLMIALGGALGGVFVCLLSPLLFRGYDELYVGLLACAALATAFTLKSPAYRPSRSGLWNPVVPALVIVVGVVGMLFVGRVLTRARPGLRELRNFYGILRVEDLGAPDGEGTVRYLTHGGTRHGQQFQDPARRSLPTTYYGTDSGIGILLDETSGGAPRRIGLVGLGAGILAAYGRAGDVFRFYEINPLVVEVATRDFTFLADSSATIEIVPGDARLSLANDEDERFDVLILDAFSSDSIPVHLLTLEAFELYERRLAPEGVLALHVTTRHLDLGPLIAGLARRLGKQAWEIASPADEQRGLLDARWILVLSEHSLLALARVRAAGKPLDPGTAVPRLWTDDYSNLLQVLK